MNCQNDFPWDAVHELLLDCGRAQSPRDLAVRAIKGINAMVPFDQGRIYSVSVNGEVFDSVLFGVDKCWPRVYCEYYSQILGGKYSLPNRALRNSRLTASDSKCGVYEWQSGAEDEFVADYIRPQRLRHSFGFGMYDTFPTCKRVLMLDRTGRAGFSEWERGVLSILAPHLENLHRNFYIGAGDECAVGRIGSSEGLTPREAEIADMIGKGFSPGRISAALFISRATVYKHIMHIHTKMGVSCRQELLVKLLHGRGGAKAAEGGVFMADT
ncbi:MAG: helix-turn-helix transcriptional regulator [Clostridiales Family XIII bacterium]|nr:helix-turn-helix transcriptional regulator [Clostridiales Family XIII bacterium]